MEERTTPDGPVSDTPHRVSALGEAVARRRQALGLRQADLAELAGCSERFIHTVEHGKESLRLDKVLDVLEVVGLGLFVAPGTGRVDVLDGTDGGGGTPAFGPQKRRQDLGG